MTQAPKFVPFTEFSKLLEKDGIVANFEPEVEISPFVCMRNVTNMLVRLTVGPKCTWLLRMLFLLSHVEYANGTDCLIYSRQLMTLLS